MKKENHSGQNNLKVGILTTSFPRYPGDPAGIFVFELAKYLTLNGVKVEVVAPHDQVYPSYENMDGIIVRRFRYAWPTTLERLAYRGGIMLNLKKYFLAKLQLPFFLIASFFCSWRLATRCDIIHVHWLQNSWPIIIYKIFFRKPMVLTIHGTDINELSVGRGTKLFSRLMLKKTDKIIAVSHDIKNKICQLGINSEKIVVLPNGVPDLKSFLRLPAKPINDFSILFVGRLIRSKNLRLLLKAVADLQTKLPQIKMCVVGEGPLRGELAEEAEKLHIAQRIKFVGRKNRQEIIEFYRAADLFVSPSRAEGFSLVVLEALAAGLPVIATNVGVAPEVIKHQENGWLIPVDDVTSLEGAIYALCADVTLRERIMQESRKTITDQFNWQTIAKKTKDLYRELVGY